MNKTFSITNLKIIKNKFDVMFKIVTLLLKQTMIIHWKVF